MAFFDENVTAERAGVDHLPRLRCPLLLASWSCTISGVKATEKLLGAGPWPDEILGLDDRQRQGLLLVDAAAGKSALVPFSGWLPRAMEGRPRCFMGALSVHLGRFAAADQPLTGYLHRPLGGGNRCTWLDGRPYSHIWPEVQTDIKAGAALPASLSQVGFIVAEIGLGFRYLGAGAPAGACPPANFQFVRGRAQSFARLPHDRNDQTVAPAPFRTLWNRLPNGRDPNWLIVCRSSGAVSDGLDAIHRRAVRSGSRWCDALERRWTDFLAGEASANGPSQAFASSNDRRVFMNLLHLPWLELAIAITLLGSAVPLVRNSTSPTAGAWRSSAHQPAVRCWYGWPLRWCAARVAAAFSTQPALFGLANLRAGRTECTDLLDDRAITLFLTAPSDLADVWRGGTRSSWSMAAKTVVLLLFSCKDPWILTHVAA